MEEQLRKEFNKRIKALKLDEQAKEELFDKFKECWDTGFRCFYCRKRMELHFENEFSFSIDHTIPKAKNGQDVVQNLEFACRDCNLLKGDMNAEKYINNMERLKLRKQKREYWKARKASKKDKQTREAYKDIFQHINAKKELHDIMEEIECDPKVAEEAEKKQRESILTSEELSRRFTI